MAKKRVLVLVGGQWHPFECAGEWLRELFESTGRYVVEVTEDHQALKKGAIDRFDAVVAYTQGGKLTRDQEAGLLGFVKGGGAFVGLHSATASWQENAGYIDMIGGVFKSHGPVIEFPVTIHGGKCWITDRMGDFRISDEFYIMDGVDEDRVEVLATAQWHNKTHPMAYIKPYGDGRVFYLALGHDERAFNHPSFQKLTVRGLDWALGRKPRAPLKAGCIGYGPSFNIARLHLESMQKAGLDVVAACDLRADRREAAQAEWPGIETFASATTMLKKSSVELVAVCTEHNVHARLVEQCLNAGRHTVTEKPMCVSAKEGAAMIAAARKNKRMLSVFHNRRWDGDYMAIKDIVARGLLGDVFQIELFMGHYGHPSYWWRSDKRISGGAFLDWGAHCTDWVLGLVPAKIAEVSGHFVHKAVWHDVTNEDHCLASVRFANGCHATIEWSYLAAAPKTRWRILGTKGGLTDLGSDVGKFKVVTFKDGSRVDCEIPYKESDWHAYYRNVTDHLMLGEPLVVTPESSRRVIAVLEAAEQSSLQGKAIVPAKDWA
ncbi:MAG TPA: ThuA domain-containing protein [Candidatus Hydrogenedentes bacterium]|nr:ThuA domain-containing protein [Candidatus Hydrogenedentota bacterium]HPG69008.1 ThuA domain-containing protein [Candidatus Hydrogenedentota bacterium]